MEKGGEKPFFQTKKEIIQSHESIYTNDNNISDIIIKINGKHIKSYSINTINKHKYTIRHYRSSYTTSANSLRHYYHFSNGVSHVSRIFTNGQKEKGSSRMDRRYYHGINTSFNIHSFSFSNLSSSHFIIRRFQNLFRCIQKLLDKLKFPLVATSTTYLFSLVQKPAHAELLVNQILENGKVKNGLFTKEKMIENHTGFTGLWNKFDQISDFIINIINWLKNFTENMYHITIDLLTWTYEFLVQYVLFTPLFLFNNNFIKGVTTNFYIISITLIIFGIMYESVMKMIKKNHMRFRKMLKNIPIAFATAGFSPFLFQFTFSIINELSKAIIKLGGDTFNSDQFINMTQLGLSDVFIMLAFDIILIYVLIVILLQNGKRWWDLFCLSTTTPLALSAWVFDRYRYIFHKWFSKVKELAIVQLVYATFIMLMVGFITASRFIDSQYWLFKLLILLGALFRLANPPSIVKKYISHQDNVDDMFKNGNNTIKRIKNTLTFKNFTPLKYYREQKLEKIKIQQLRQKHGRRYIKNLK